MSKYCSDTFINPESFLFSGETETIFFQAKDFEAFNINHTSQTLLQIIEIKATVSTLQLLWLHLWTPHHHLLQKQAI